ncbi:Os05g0132300 [Oryza sativa Japonica Group]|uniref:Os05g0132300 protein n=2 Tax=Oryza TaxID=4527 RepID=Q6AUR7_ORYSJ|nr:unknown protein [Oryza sativa Japonica Group]AAU44231.1 unknown protein [Oryza sativa Japonica Group]BAF16471.1 Os05g0132300 [Oryza sativa Japonica Group]|eukprot:NP_001054557.1 Os05g0132300 [Oryza sativa Japonica Group]
MQAYNTPSHAVNLAAHARHHRLRRARRPALVALAVMADPLASLARAMEVVPDSEMEVAPVSSSE